MIELKKITKKYKKTKYNEEKIALSNIEYCFPDSGLFYITGKSGSGKSTLLNIISGIDTTFSGDVLVDGKSTKSFSYSEMEYYRSSYIGYVFQDFNLLTDLTPYENVKLGYEVSSNNNVNEIDNVFSELDIEDLKNRRIKDLSGGEKQRIAIARALVKNPKVIIADEPTGSLDPINSDIIMSLLYKISKTRLVIVVTHNIDFLDKYESVSLSLNNGVLESKSRIEENTNKFLAEKSRGLSKNLICRMGFSILFRKKITLFLSLLFIILSCLCFSISLSGMNYKEADVAFNTTVKYDDFIVMKRGSSFENDSLFDEEANSILESYNKKGINRFNVSDIATSSDVNISSYYLNCNIYSGMENSEIYAFNYEESRELFDLKIINGSIPSTDNEIVISDLVAEFFVLMDYKYDGTSKYIDSYDDIIGLNLFGYTISGVVSTIQSDSYINYYKNHRTDYSPEEEQLYSKFGCGFSIFTKKSLYENKNVVLEFDYLYKTYNLTYGDDCKTRKDFKENVIYLPSCDSSSKGMILNIDYASKIIYGKEYEEEISYKYETYRNSSYYDSLSDSELEDYVRNGITNSIVDQFSSGFAIDMYPQGEKDNWSFPSYQFIQKVIGISSDTSSNVMLYIDDTEIEDELKKMSSYNNVDAIYTDVDKSKNTKRYFNYLYTNSTNLYNNEIFYYLSNEVVENLYDCRDMFNALKIIFTALALIFVSIAMFIVYKYISDSIMYKIQDIGVLKAIGVSNKDVIKIFSIQNIFISLFTCLFTIPLQYVGIYLINNITSKIYNIKDYFVKAYSIGVVNYIFVIIIAVFIPLIVSLYPIEKCRRKSPKDILSNN